MIKSIKTNYNGKIFRSRLEADVSFLLDSLNIKWAYEPISFLLENGVHYMPDYFLFGQNTWLECRGYYSEKGQKQLFSFIKSIKENKLIVPLHFDSEKFAVLSKTSMFINSDKAYKELYVSKCSDCGKWQFGNINDECYFCKSNEKENVSCINISEQGKIYFIPIIIDGEFTEGLFSIMLPEWIENIKNDNLK